jgi:hypothetical protein
VSRALERCKAQVAKRSSALRTTALVVPLGRQRLASASLFDLAGSAIPPHAVGSRRQVCHRAGQRLPSPRLRPSKTVGFSLRAAIFAIPVPLVLTIEAHSTTLRNSARASERSAEPGRGPVAALEPHHCVSLGMASERGLGLVAGSQATGDRPVWGADYVHALRDLLAGRHQWERQASAAMAKADDAARQCVGAHREAHRAKRLPQADTAPQAGAPAIALYDPRAMRRHWRREAFHVCSPHGSWRPQANGRSARRRLCAMLHALAGAAMPHPLPPMRPPSDAMVVPFPHAQAMATARRGVGPHEA